MLIPRSHAWTPLQKWLIIGSAVAVLALCAAFIYQYERHFRGPTEAVFVGTWQEFVHDPWGPGVAGGSYTSFKPDHTYEQFIMVSRPGGFDEPFVLQSGAWYAGGDFIYLRLPWDQVSSTALLPWRIDSVSPTRIDLHWGPATEVLKRVDASSPNPSNQSMKPRP
jgi:hypothetical protein